MRYNEIYEIVVPIMDWLKEHFPHNHEFVINTTGAELQETGKMVINNKKEWETFAKSVKNDINEFAKSFPAKKDTVENGCKYCNGKKLGEFFNDVIVLEGQDGKYYEYRDYNFCPMCGRKMSA